MEYELRFAVDDDEPALQATGPAELLNLAEKALLPATQDVVVDLRMRGRRIAMVHTIVAELAPWVRGEGALPRPCLS